ncbi:MAG: hypothetical protein RMJ59_01350 [Candidatus Nitrosocaldus sp.]|nr:hypothetical protein [Candidatus Nitrosocaldus sp.]MDW8275011.1 hypothetical protein [Candidatus Nitrosocaldus sp.]
MARMLYWHLTPQEVLAKPYPVDKLIHWEVRCTFSRDSYCSVYWFRAGVPYDKEPILGIAFYANGLSRELEEDLIRFLHERVGGRLMRRSYRTFFAEARIRSDNEYVAGLALSIAERFNAVCEIWLELDGLSDVEAKALYTAKAVPVS